MGKVRNFRKIHLEESLPMLGTTRCLSMGGSRSSPWNTLTLHLRWVIVWLLIFQTPSWDLTISPALLLTLPQGCAVNHFSVIKGFVVHRYYLIIIGIRWPLNCYSPNNDANFTDVFSAPTSPVSFQKS